MTEQSQEGRSQAILETQSDINPELLSFGATIRLFRVKKGLTQDELAARMKSCQTTISGIEVGSTFPKKSTVPRLVQALGFEINSAETNLIVQQYKTEKESKRKDPIMASLQDYLRKHNHVPVSFSAIAQELGVSRNSISGRYRMLQAANPQLSPNIRVRRLDENMTIRVRVLRRAGWKSAKKIAGQLHTSEAYVNRILHELREKGEIPRLKRKNRTKEEIAETDLKVKELHDQGLTIKQIAKKLAEPFSRISDTVNRLRSKGLIKRRGPERKKRPIRVFP